MNHTQLINHLISKHNLKSYLEIGVNHPANNLNKIRCNDKTGVDPAIDFIGVERCTSDNFFEHGPQRTFDLIFIDGLHHADQVKRDFENSLRCLNDGGFIVIHDCLPEDEITTCVPRGNQKMWHGDVYKFCMTLKSYSGIDFITYDFDNGCCVVWEDEAKKGSLLYQGPFNWTNYKTIGKELMNVRNEPVTI